MRWLPRALVLGGGSLVCISGSLLPSRRINARMASSSQQQPAAPRPRFTFGLIADVQWADDEDGYNYDRTVARRYRGAFRNLVRAVDWWLELAEPPNFIAQLGDLIDGINVKLEQSESSLAAALAELRRAPCPAVNIVGNHELYNFDRASLAEASWLRHGDKEFYSFQPAAGWRMVVLDPYQMSLIGHSPEDPRRLESVELIKRRNPGVDPSGVGGDWFKHVSGHDKRFVPYNGGLGREQLAWLRAELADASAAGERVVILCHVILHPKGCGGSTMVWDYPEALDAIRQTDCVAAVLCGHDHFGQYHMDRQGVHHCTFCSPLNKGDEGSAFGLVRVFDDAIEVCGPRVDDLLPTERKTNGVVTPTGRPPKQLVVLAGEDEEGSMPQGSWESVLLPLRSRSSGQASTGPGEVEEEEPKPGATEEGVKG